MKTETKTISIKEAQAVICGMPMSFNAAADGDDSKPAGFKMVLYTGGVFAGHWYWGDIYLDVKGFRLTRPDIPAIVNHSVEQTAGYTTEITAKGNEIHCVGNFLQGTFEEEPHAYTVLSRLQQGYPYQCSGRWQPMKIERVEEKVTAKVNGMTVEGPCTIFREFDLLEASFCQLGWDSRTSAVAASADDENSTINVELTTTRKEEPMPEPTKTPASDSDGQNTSGSSGLLASLKECVGAEKAIDLVTARPDATALTDFNDEFIEIIKANRDALNAAQGKVAELQAANVTLKADLEAAKAAPVVITATGDPSTPKPDTVEATGEDKWRADFKASNELQAEFPGEDGEEKYVTLMRHETRNGGQ